MTQLMVRDEDVQLIKDTYCKDSTDAELRLFIAVCNRLQLDPFARQIFAVRRYDTDLKRTAMAIQVSIDGLRLAAERTGDYRGQSKFEWCGADGKWADVWLEDGPPVAARVFVHRAGHSEPMEGIAHYLSYAQYTKEGGITKRWGQAPEQMLAKCAEALALRRAFPILSNLYIHEELVGSRDAEEKLEVIEPLSLDALDDSLSRTKQLIERVQSSIDLPKLLPAIVKHSEHEQNELRKVYKSQLQKLRVAETQVHKFRAQSAAQDASPVQDGGAVTAAPLSEPPWDAIEESLNNERQ